MSLATIEIYFSFPLLLTHQTCDERPGSLNNTHEKPLSPLSRLSSTYESAEVVEMDWRQADVRGDGGHDSYARPSGR